jgi:hypothetical protein
MKLLLWLWIMDPVCAKPALLEMMLLVQFSHPSLAVQGIKE